MPAHPHVYVFGNLYANEIHICTQFRKVRGGGAGFSWKVFPNETGVLGKQQLGSFETPVVRGRHSTTHQNSWGWDPNLGNFFNSQVILTSCQG